MIVTLVGLYVGAEVATSGWMVRLWAATEGTAASGSLWLMGFFVCLSLGRAATGLFSDGWNGLRPVGYCLAASLVCSALGLLLALPLLSLTALFMAPVVPLTISFLTKRFPQCHGQVTAMALSSFSLFIAGTHVAIGFLSNATGSVRAALWITVFELAAALLVWMGLLWHQSRPAEN